MRNGGYVCRPISFAADPLSPDLWHETCAWLCFQARILAHLDSVLDVPAGVSAAHVSVVFVCAWLVDASSRDCICQEEGQFDDAEEEDAENAGSAPEEKEDPQ